MSIAHSPITVKTFQWHPLIIFILDVTMTIFVAVISRVVILLYLSSVANYRVNVVSKDHDGSLKKSHS